MNIVVLLGNLVREPELRYTPAGTPVSNFTIAVDRRPNAEGQREADFIDVVVWSKLAETCASNLVKGQRVGVEGRLQLRNYETTDGQKRRAAEVIAEDVRFLDKPRGAQDDGEAESA